MGSNLGVQCAWIGSVINKRGIRICKETYTQNKRYIERSSLTQGGIRKAKCPIAKGSYPILQSFFWGNLPHQGPLNHMNNISKACEGSKKRLWQKIDLWRELAHVLMPKATPKPYATSIFLVWRGLSLFTLPLERALHGFNCCTSSEWCGTSEDGWRERACNRREIKLQNQIETHRNIRWNVIYIRHHSVPISLIQWHFLVGQPKWTQTTT